VRNAEYLAVDDSWGVRGVVGCLRGGVGGELLVEPDAFFLAFRSDVEL
jgi:hypothetical protein